MIAEAAAGIAANQLMANPQATARLARTTVLRAVGATDDDLQHTVTQGIPPLVLATVALAIGGILAVRYLPERWQTKIRRFGK